MTDSLNVVSHPPDQVVGLAQKSIFEQLESGSSSFLGQDKT